MVSLMKTEWSAEKTESSHRLKEEARRTLGTKARQDKAKRQA